MFIRNLNFFILTLLFVLFFKKLDFSDGLLQNFFVSLNFRLLFNLQQSLLFLVDVELFSEGEPYIIKG